MDNGAEKHGKVTVEETFVGETGDSNVEADGMYDQAKGKTRYTREKTDEVNKSEEAK
jgi:hypothetical protein